MEAVLTQPDFSGVGYVFAREDPYFGCDVDAAFRSDADEGPDFLPAILEGFQQAYIEESVSETGLHIIGRGRLPDNVQHLSAQRRAENPTLQARALRRSQIFHRQRARQWCRSHRRLPGVPGRAHCGSAFAVR